jgi:hypothetical protein
MDDMEKIIILKNENGLTYLIKAISKETNDNLKVDIHNTKLNNDFISFEKKYKIKINDVEAFGDTSVSEIFLKRYIPFIDYHPFGDITKWERSSKCYAIKEHNYKLNYLHFDCRSSWNCILQILNNPKYVLIYTKNEI